MYMKTYFKNKLEECTPNQIHDNGYSAKRERGIEWEWRTKSLHGIFFFFKTWSIMKKYQQLSILSCKFTSVYSLPLVKEQDFLKTKKCLEMTLLVGWWPIFVGPESTECFWNLNLKEYIPFPGVLTLIHSHILTYFPQPLILDVEW